MELKRNNISINRFLSFAIIAILIALFTLFFRCQSNSTSIPYSWPVYPGCEKFQSDSVRKWCFKKNFTADLEQKLNKLKFSGLPDDTIYIYVRIDSTGIFHADSIRPEVSTENDRKIDSILQTFRAIPAHEGHRAVELRFSIPVVARQGR